MPTTSEPDLSELPRLPQIPPTSLPVVDERTGLMRREWYEYFRAERDRILVLQGVLTTIQGEVSGLIDA